VGPPARRRRRRSVTAELAGLVVDQCTLVESRFTLLAPDDYRGDTLDVKLWDARGDKLAARACTTTSEPRRGHPHPPHAQGVRRRAGRPRDADRAVRARPLGAEPPPHQPVALPVVGPAALERLKQASGEEAAGKLDRAPTLVVVSSLGDEEDRDATAAAAYIVLLAAHGRGLATYWRTPEVLNTPEGRAAVGVGEDEQVLGLLHLGRPRQEQRVPERAPVDTVVTWLD
jgi:nitroreductase